MGLPSGSRKRGQRNADPKCGAISSQLFLRLPPQSSKLSREFVIVIQQKFVTVIPEGRDKKYPSNGDAMRIASP
jgi:hypothetical protein